jgi:single-strand DNA-binding protein
MKSLRNSVQLIGNLGMDPEVKEVSNGNKMVRFSLATSESYRNQKGEKVTENPVA